MTEKEQNEKISREIAKAEGHQAIFEASIIEELKTSVKWKLSVMMLLIFFCAMKVADLVWDWDRNRDLQSIMLMVKANADAIAESKQTITNIARDRDAIIQHMQASSDGTASEKAMISKNHEAILRVDDHLRQCSGCHSHPETIKSRMSNRPVN